MIRFTKFAAGALLLSASPAALAQSAGWTVSEASGPVVIQDAAGKHAAQRGTVVAVGATLSTGAGARAVVVRGKDFMTVNANSRVRIPAQAEQRGVLDVLQDWGNALFQIEKKPNPHFGVRTPYLAAVVKGTTFSITVTEQGSSLQVVEGAVETSTSDGGARELIRPGVVAIVSAADRFRLTVQGQDSRTIDSPQRGTPDAAAPAPAPAAADPVQPDAGATASTQFGDAGSAGAGQVAEVQMIDTLITASAADLGKITDGLVGGSTGVQVASVEVAAVRATADPRNNPGTTGAAKGNDNGGSGNGNGNANAGSDNSNAGGNGNGNGNANAGSDNSNAGGNGNANSGSDNSNAGGNGNGKSKSDDDTVKGNGKGK